MCLRGGLRKPARPRPERRIRVERAGGAARRILRRSFDPEDPGTTPTCVPLTAGTAALYHAGGADARSQPAVSDGSGNPCRRLRDIPKGAGMPILARRPFDALQPCAEAGPIFMCADECHPAPDAQALPDTTRARTQAPAKGCMPNDRIHYGTGRIVRYGTGRIMAPEALEAASEALLEDERTACLHARSATDNCCTCREERT